MKFRFSKDFVVDTSKEPFNREGLRVTMLGGPGSGKSYNNCLIAEQFLTQHGTIVVFQPRDEYYTLKEKFDVVCVGGVHAKDIDFALTKPKMYAKHVVEDGISMIFYTAGRDEQKLVSWVSRFIEHLLTLQETHHRPLLIILEEAQDYVPKNASGHVAPPWVFNQMVRSFTKCFTEGRKLNVIAIASSQRPQQLDFTIRQLANVKFFGKFSSQDINYVDKECLKIIREGGIDVKASKLQHLKKTEWLVNCELMTDYIMVTHPRLTKHGAETPKLEYIAPRTNETKRTVSDLAAAIKEALEKEAAEQSELEKAKRKIRDLEKKLEVAEEKARIKLSVKDMLEGDGDAEELAEKLAKTDEELRSVTEAYEEMAPKFVELEERLTQFKREHEIVENLRKLFVVETAGSPGLEPGSTEIVHTETVPEIEHKVEYPIVETNEKTMLGRVITLASEGFFKEKQKISDISREITRVFAVSVNLKDVNKALTKAVQLKILQREKDSHKAWIYWLVQGVQERIKEVDSFVA
jgi:hypothetical protein